MTLTVLASVLVGTGLLRLRHVAVGARAPARARRRNGARSAGRDPSRDPGARGASDELGDLARSFKNLLGRLREHTEYLRTLASKLSHELRTPLAVVTTSLDNLEHEKVTRRGGRLSRAAAPRRHSASTRFWLR